MLLRNAFHPSSEWVTLVLEGAEVAGLKEHVSYIAWLRLLDLSHRWRKKE